MFLCLLLYPWVGSCNSVTDSLLKIINANSSTHMHNPRITNQRVQPAAHNQLQKSHNLQANTEAHQTTRHVSQHPQVSSLITLNHLVLHRTRKGQKYLYFQKKGSDFRPIKTCWKKQNSDVISNSGIVQPKSLVQLSPSIQQLKAAKPLAETGRQLCLKKELRPRWMVRWCCQGLEPQRGKKSTN